MKKVPWWVPGDWNAFFGLGTNSLLNVLVLSGLLLGVIEMPAEIVFGRIVPAVGLMLLISNVYYALMARRLAIKTGRTDVTAMPAGPSVPHMFIVVLAIMLPVKIATGDPIKAWEAGLAWVFIEGLVNVSGAFIAPLVRRLTPRAALLGTLAGVSIAFIALQPAMQDLFDALDRPGLAGHRPRRMVCWHQVPVEHPGRPGGRCRGHDTGLDHGGDERSRSSRVL